MNYPKIRKGEWNMKKLMCAVLAFVLAAACLPSFAATYYIQDMDAFAEGLVEYKEYYDRETHGQYYYKVNKDNVQAVVESFCAMLMQDPIFTYLGYLQHGDYVYQCFDMAKGHMGVDQFYVHHYGEKLTPDCVIALQYKLDSSTVYLRFSKDLLVGEKGYRMSNVGNLETFLSMLKPYVMPAPTRVPTATSAMKTCTECSGRGVLGATGSVECPVCKGKGYIASTQSSGGGFLGDAGFVYVPGYGWTTAAPTGRPVVTPNPGSGYWGGNCTQCGGDGHVTCYCCSGTGQLGCSGCGGDGWN